MASGTISLNWSVVMHTTARAVNLHVQLSETWTDIYSSILPLPISPSTVARAAVLHILYSITYNNIKNLVLATKKEIYVKKSKTATLDVCCHTLPCLYFLWALPRCNYSPYYLSLRNDYNSCTYLHDAIKVGCEKLLHVLYLCSCRDWCCWSLCD